MTQELSYATPHRSGPSIWAAAVLAFVGLGLIVLGGCFLIGVMLLQAPGVFDRTATVWTPMTVLFLLILYGMAAVCFAGALYLLVTTARKLYKLLDAV